MSTRKPNALFGLFTRHEERRGKVARTAARRHKSLKHRLKGAARRKLGAFMGIPLSRDLLSGKGASSRHGAHHGTSPAGGSTRTSTVRSDVIEALRGQGYSAGTAKKMAAGVTDRESFDSAFRRVISKNPGELIIFGNPSTVYTRKGLTSSKRAGNPIPVAIVQAFESAAGSKLFDSVTSKKKNSEARRKKRNGLVEEIRSELQSPDATPQQRTKLRSLLAKHSRKQFFSKEGTGYLHDGKRTVIGKISGHRKKKNPAGAATDRATQLFEKFHHRPATDVFERQRSARVRKDYTILGVLVAIGINAEHFDKLQQRAGKKQFSDYVVEHYDKLPRLDFLTPGQVGQVKNMLGDPGKYVKDAPMLASSPSGRQLYALAEDVQLDLSQFDTDTQKDYVDLGEATFVVYIAKKPDEVREWVHIMGEDGGTRPQLMYDRLRKEVCFIGGSYVVKAPGIMH